MTRKSLETAGVGSEAIQCTRMDKALMLFNGGTALDATANVPFSFQGVIRGTRWSNRRKTSARGMGGRARGDVSRLPLSVIFTTLITQWRMEFTSRPRGSTSAQPLPRRSGAIALQASDAGPFALAPEGAFGSLYAVLAHVTRN